MLHRSELSCSKCPQDPKQAFSMDEREGEMTRVSKEGGMRGAEEVSMRERACIWGWGW